MMTLIHHIEFSLPIKRAPTHVCTLDIRLENGYSTSSSLLLASGKLSKVGLAIKVRLTLDRGSDCNAGWTIFFVQETHGSPWKHSRVMTVVFVRGDPSVSNQSADLARC